MPANPYHDTEEKLSSLRVHEWLAITIVIGVIAGLTCLTSFYGKDSSHKFRSDMNIRNQSGFDVLIKGAVKHPGIYHIQSEMAMKDLLVLAEVSLNGDLRRFNLDTVVKKGRVINIPVRKMMNIHLKGAIEEEQTISVPVGTKVEDLLKIVKFLPEADLNFLRKKRKLKSEEVITIPSNNELKSIALTSSILGALHFCSYRGKELHNCQNQIHVPCGEATKASSPIS